MVSEIDVGISMAQQCIPLPPMLAFVGSPSNIRLRQLPPAAGDWRIERVYLSVHMPDDRALTIDAVEAGGGVFVASVPASETAGSVGNGWSVRVDGIDERGNAFSGMVLGTGDVRILSADGSVASEGVRYYMHVVETLPESPNPGDTYYDASTENWQIFWQGEWRMVNSSGGDSPLDGRVYTLVTIDDYMRMAREMAEALGAQTSVLQLSANGACEIAVDESAINSDKTVSLAIETDSDGLVSAIAA